MSKICCTFAPAFALRAVVLENGREWQKHCKKVNTENQPLADFVKKSQMIFCSSGIKAVILHPLSPQKRERYKKVIFERLFD